MGELQLLGWLLLVVLIIVSIAVWRVGTILAFGSNRHIAAIVSIERRLARIEATLAAGRQGSDADAR